MIVFLCVVLLLVFLYLLITYIAFLYVFKVFRKKKMKSVDSSLSKNHQKYKNIFKEGREWVASHNPEDLYITSFDNLKLHAVLIKHDNSKGVIVIAHGYRSTKEHDLYGSAHEYFSLGMDLVYIDQRGCGESEGDYITFGINESKDISSWVDYISTIYKNKPIMIGGISLGGASVLMVNNKRVKGIIADCAFISPYEEISYCCRHYMHIPPFVAVPMIRIYAKIIAKIDIKKESAIENKNNINVPVLLIHGTGDDFVPHNNSQRFYDEYKGSKEILLVEGAEHGMSYLVDRNAYVKSISSFINICCN